MKKKKKQFAKREINVYFNMRKQINKKTQFAIIAIGNLITQTIGLIILLSINLYIMTNGMILEVNYS